jgi:PAS domain S-box-containing protein
LTVIGRKLGGAPSSEQRSRSRRSDDLKAAEQNQFQAQLLDLVQNIVVATDASGRVTYWNKFAEQRYGASRAEVLGKPVAEVIPFDQEPPPGLRETLARGEPWFGEVSANRANGPSVTTLLTVTPIKDDSGNMTGIVTVGLDVSERKRMEEALRETEARLRGFFENAASGLSVTDLEGRVVLCNPKLESILGYTGEELRGMSFAEFTHPDDVAEDAALFQELLAGKRDRYEVEKRYIRKDGKTVPVRLVVSVARTTDRRPTLLIAIAEDIAESKRIEQELRSSREQLEKSERFQRSLTVLSVLANSTLDLDEMLPRICSAVTTAFDMSAASIFLVSGQNTLELVGTTGLGMPVSLKCDATERPFAAGQAFCEGRPLYYDHMDGATLAAPIVLGGETIGALALVAKRFDRFDDSDLSNASQIAHVIAGAIRNARLYRSEQEIARQLRQMERSRTSFLRIMGHEVRTPLGQIIGFGDLLSAESDRLSERGQRYLANVQHAAQALLPLVQRSLDLMALYQEGVVLDQVRIGLEGLVKSALTRTHEKANAKNLSVNFEARESQLQTTGDVQRLAQVIDILLDNAVKFTAEGGWIQVALGRTNGHVDLSVQDSGCGVPEDLAAYIFSHGQADDPMTRGQGGTGLSLLTARRVAELHGGQLRLEPSEVGAHFVLSLPV